MDSGNLVHQVIVSVTFSLIGIAMFGLVYVILVKILPFSLRKEIEEDENVALGIVIGSLIIGISIIVSSAIS